MAKYQRKRGYIENEHGVRMSYPAFKQYQRERNRIRARRKALLKRYQEKIDGSTVIEPLWAFAPPEMPTFAEIKSDKELGIRRNTMKWYANPQYKRRVVKPWVEGYSRMLRKRYGVNAETEDIIKQLQNLSPDKKMDFFQWNEQGLPDLIWVDSDLEYDPDSDIKVTLEDIKEVLIKTKTWRQR